MTLIKKTKFDNAYLKLIKNHQIYGISLQESASIITRQCAEALKASRASVWLLSENFTQLTCLSLYISDSDEFQSGATICAGAVPNYFRALLNSRVIDAHHAPTDSRTQELASTYLEPLGIKSLLDATLRHEGKVQGVLCAEMIDSQRTWTKDEEIFVASVADLVSQKLIINQLEMSEAKYKALFESANEGICVFGDNKLIDINPAGCKIFKFPKNDLIGKTLDELSPEYQAEGQLSSIKMDNYIQACLCGNPQSFEWEHTQPDGKKLDVNITLYMASLSNKNTLFASIRDITAKKEAERQTHIAQEKLAYRATHDSLTGLLNREQLHVYVNNMIGGVIQQGIDTKIALLLFDLNRFKEINDTLGHWTGDKLLKKLALIIKQHVKTFGGRLFRLGGDEFVVVFDSQNHNKSFKDIDSTLHQCLKTPIDIDDISIEMSASVGISVFPDNGKDSHELLRCADVAMYYAKNNDDPSPWYNIKNDLNNKRRLAMAVELGHAIRDDQLLLHFQPRIDIKSEQVTGCEALVRWQHPKLGLVFPDEFIPLAEMSDLIHPLSNWVLNNAFTQIKRLQNKGQDVPVAVNLSARNLTDSQLVSMIESLLVSEKIEPRLLEIEITESALINHPQRAVENLTRLDKLGVSMAIDDFGTGYSSLSYLKKLPIDTIKIDRSFVQDMLVNESDSVIVGSTINLAHNFSHTVVAEGVENLQTLNALSEKHCDQAQGYYIAKPMPADEFEYWLNEYNKDKIYVGKKSS